MLLLPAGNPTQDEPRRKDIVSAVGEGFFEGYEDEVEEVREKVEAAEEGGKVGRKEDAEDIRERMVVVGNQTVGSHNGVLP